MRSSLPVLFSVLQRNDEEAVVDRGGTRSILKTHFEKEDLEGERLFFCALYFLFLLKVLKCNSNV